MNLAYLWHGLAQMICSSLDVLGGPRSAGGITFK